MTDFNEMQTVKRRMYAMRNGIVADSLRKGGSPFRMIFGVNIPQLAEIAEETGKNATLAAELYADRSTRESMLIAPMLYPADEMTPELAMEWLRLSPTPEVTDILCHKLLRKLPFAAEIAEKCLESDNSDMMRYAGVRLLWNLLPSPASMMRPLAVKEAERNCPLTKRVAQTLVEEIDFLSEA